MKRGDADAAVEAATARALELARRRDPASLVEAAEAIEAVRALAPSRIVAAKLAHAEGYVRYLRNEEHAPVRALDRAASLFPRDHPLRARVFDTLGAYFHHTAGDLHRARDAYQLAYDDKRALVDREGLEAMWHELSVSAGNLSWIEIALERWEEAERWTRVDLELDAAWGHLGRDRENARVRATLLGQLARIALERRPHARDEILDHLERSLAAAPAGSYTEAHLWLDAARVRWRLGDRDDAERLLARATELARTGGYPQLEPDLRFLRGQLGGDGVKDPEDRRFLTAYADLEAARAAFAELHQHADECEVVHQMASLLHQVGRAADAKRAILERGLPVAERHLAGSRQPLPRLEALLAWIDPEAPIAVRERRARGGVPAETYLRRRGERRERAVVTCDLRGFAALADAAVDPAAAIATLDRYLRAIGEVILDAGGVIEAYVGDDVLASVDDAATAARVAIAARRRVDELALEGRLLGEPALALAVGVAAGPVIAGTVGFPGKLQEGIVGATVDLARRLLRVAGAGEIVVDRATATAVRGACRTRKLGARAGLDRTPAWLLLGAEHGERRQRRRGG